MELDLSLGETSSKTIESSHEDNNTSKVTESPRDHHDQISMGLGLRFGSQEHEKSRENNEDNDDDDEDIVFNENHEVELNLLSLAPVPRRRHLQSRQACSFDNANGSSNDMGSPATALRLDVGRTPAAAEDAEAEELSSERASPRTCSDDEELNVVNNNNNSRKKLRLSKEQSAFLEEHYKIHNNLNPNQKLALAKQLNLRPRQVEVWFQNRRARTKLKQTEADCEYLKQRCETLTNDNKRLQRELQDLRALNTNPIFYNISQFPPLTVCPSCKHITGTSPPTTTTVAVDSISAIDSSPKDVTVPVNNMSRPRFNFPFSYCSTSPSHTNNDPHSSAAD